MAGNLYCQSSSIKTELDLIFKSRVGAARANVGIKVAGVDIANRYEQSIGGDLIGFNTGWKSAGTDIKNYFQNINFITLIQYLLTVVSGSGGGMKDSGSYAPITASASPSHYHFSTWTGDTVVAPTSAQTTILMSAAKTVTATYTINTYYLTVTNGTGDGTYNYNATMSVAASAAPSYQVFNNWSNPVGNLSFSNSAASSTNAFFTADGDSTAEAVYNWINYTVQAVNGSGGSSTALNGNSSGAPFSLTNNSNYAYSLVATPTTNYAFDYWSHTGNAPASTTAASTTVVITGNNTLTSHFLPYPTVQASNGIGGSVTTINGDGSGGVITIAPGTYNLVATPSTGYYFTTWTVNSGATPTSTTAASTTLTLPVNTTNHVTSNFAAYVAATGITWSVATPYALTTGQVINLGVTPSGGTSPFVYDWWIRIDGGSWSGPSRDGSTHDFGAVYASTIVEIAVEVRCQGYEAAVYDSDVEGTNWIGNI